jgi:outer membrane protein assembly factor BamB
MRRLRIGMYVVALLLLMSSLFNGFSVVTGDDVPTRGNGFDEEAKWAQFRGNLNNTGYSTSTVPTTNDRFMEFPTFWQIQSSAAYANGVIYFGSQSKKVYAVEASTGLELWNHTFEGDVDSSPLVHEDTVYIGTASKSDKDPGMYAFNATTGELLWSFPTGGAISSSPKYYDGVLFFGSNDYNFYALNVTDQSHYWGAPIQTGGEIWTSPAIADGRVFFGSNDGNFSSVWIENGTLDWAFTIGPKIDSEVLFSSAAVYEGRVIVGSMDYNVYCLDEFTGDLIWTFATSYHVYASPAVHNNTVFISSNDFNFYALPLYEPSPQNGVIDNNEIIWSIPTDDFQGGSSAAVADGRVLIGSTIHGLICVNETDGSFFWNLSIPGGTVSSPTVVDGKVFIGGFNGVMYGLGASGLPSLEVEIIPDNDALKANRQMGITFLATHDQEPIEGAFVSLTVSIGELSQQGASTFSDGTNRVKYTAPTVQQNTTVTITAVASKFGFDDGKSTYQIVIERGTAYENLTTEAEFPWFKYYGYIGAVVVLVVLNVALVVLLIRRKGEEEKEEAT